MTDASPPPRQSRPSPPSFPSPAHWFVALGGVGYARLMLVWFSLPAYLPTVIADLGLSGTQAGLLAGAIPLTYVPLSLASGLFVDRVGPWTSRRSDVVLTTPRRPHRE